MRAARRSLPAPLATLAGGLLDALLPARCVVCERRLQTTLARPRTPFCPACERALPWWRAVDGCPRCGEAGRGGAEVGALPGPGAACPRCLASGSPLHRSTSLLRYEGAVARWIPGFKREGHALGPPLEPTRVIDFLARRLGERVAIESAADLDALVAVPSHPLRRLRRGFDPAQWIAARLARRTGLPLVTGSLVRTRPTPPQASLRGEARRQNVRNAFVIRGPIGRDWRIGLVDDVLTTGATLEAAADVLLEAGAWEVRALTLAATLPPAARRARTPDRHAASDAPILPPSSRRARTGFTSSRPSSPPILTDREPPGGGARSL